MKIDIHVHTKKVKQGDSPAREITPERLSEIVLSTDVKIIAITNHNIFDLEQYNQILEQVDGAIQIWPGVELDIMEGGHRGHLLVIVSPSYAESLDKELKSILNGHTADNFCISIDNVVSTFDKLKPIYITHYKQKKPDLLDDDIEKLTTKSAHKNMILKEATNAISAGIFLSHGHPSIYGSDIQNWETYPVISKTLPDLRLHVQSFEQFCLLLNKDQKAINTLLDKKFPETVSIKPFEDGKSLDIMVYDDINIFFGPKGTGKTKILDALAKYYANKGITAYRFESGFADLKEIFDFNGKHLSIDLNDYDIDYCQKEIDILRKAQEVDVTSLSRYRLFFSETLKNNKAKKIKIKEYPSENTQINERQFKTVHTIHEKFKAFNDYISTDNSVSKNVDAKKLAELIKLLEDILKDIQNKKMSAFIMQHIVKLFNNLIEKIKYEITKKTGNPQKPSKTGFYDYALNRINIELAVNSIINNCKKKIEFPPEYIGSLDDKGELYCKTEILIQDGTVSDSRLSPLKKVNKTPQKEFSKTIKAIRDHLYTQHLFEKLAILNLIEGIDSIPTILELLIFGKCFIINEKPYTPSTGESSMLVLHKELKEDKEIYILNEPEKSLGNEYINNIIVPLLKEKAKINKKIFIATHDANIAVRTLPYNSIFRSHKKSGCECETYIGNPFSNDLININNSEDKLDWKEISMRTLEGGKEAFGERGRIYGNT